MLSGLIELMEPLGSNSRAVRTSVFRLMQEDWLAATPVGRRSEYSLTPAGQRRIKHADTRIYDMPLAPWNGTWQLLLFPEGAISQEARENLRRELHWEGFAPLAPGVYAHPSADTGRIQEVLAAHKAQAKIAHLTAASLEDQSPTPLRDIVRHSWRLDEIADGYRRFIAHFEPMLDWAESAGEAHSQQLFLLRTLLIHPTTGALWVGGRGRVHAFDASGERVLALPGGATTAHVVALAGFEPPDELLFLGPLALLVVVRAGLGEQALGLHELRKRLCPLGALGLNRGHRFGTGAGLGGGRDRLGARGLVRTGHGSLEWPCPPALPRGL